MFLFWSNLIQSCPGLQGTMKKALFLRTLLITYLLTLSLEKRNYCLKKSLEKLSLEFWIQKSVQTL